ncbi:MAG TPA: hypothetical protein VLC09_17080 [Polyangiaceae bacterium]|nr:hypothetical protein [Polyangiaceae bacterium]
MMDKQKNSQWVAKAWALDASEVTGRLPVPFHVLIGEAVDAVRFAQRYAEPQLDASGRVVRPGLAAAAGQGRFTRETAEELRELVEALQAAQTDYRLLLEPSRAAPTERALFVLGELRANLEWCVEDEQLPTAEAQVASLDEAHEGAQSQDAIAAALYDYAELSQRSLSVLSQLPGFEKAWIDEARHLADRLREQSAGPASLAEAGAERSALELRNRLTTLVWERLAMVRAAARFAFRHHPAFLNEVTSRYSRKKQAAYRARRADEKEDEASTTTVGLGGPAPKLTGS